MGSIRKKTIISSVLTFIGFGIGIINIIIFGKKNFLFTADQYGLTRIYADVGQLFFGFASRGAIPVINKFFPYYKDNISDKKNDLFTRT
jgi:hypothetical protein